MSKKTKVCLIINLFLILGALTIYAIGWSAISIAAVAEKWQSGAAFDANFIRKINYSSNIAILMELGAFSILQLLAYMGYLFKNKLINYLVFILDILFGVYALGYKDPGLMLICFIPIISNIIYLALWNDTKKLRERKNRKLAMFSIFISIIYFIT